MERYDSEEIMTECHVKFLTEIHLKRIGVQRTEEFCSIIFCVCVYSQFLDTAREENCYMSEFQAGMTDRPDSDFSEKVLLLSLQFITRNFRIFLMFICIFSFYVEYNVKLIVHPYICMDIWTYFNIVDIVHIKN